MAVEFLQKKNETNPNFDPKDRDQRFKYIAMIREDFIKKGKKFSNKQMASLKIKRHEIFPNWNYTLMA